MNSIQDEFEIVVRRYINEIERVVSHVPKFGDVSKSPEGDVSSSPLEMRTHMHICRGICDTTESR